MNAIVEIDKAGRIVIPKKMRDALHLTPGTRIRIDRCGDQLRVEPDFPEPRMELRDGLMVLVGGQPISAEDADNFLNEQRERRMRFVAGLSDEP